MRIYTVFAFLGFIQTSFAQIATDSKTQVPAPMSELFGVFEDLQPYMVSEKKFKDPKNQKKIQVDLDRLSKISQKLPHEKRLTTSTFEISAQLLGAHLEVLNRVFKSGKKEYARTLLNATLNGCSSCHSQVAARSKNVWKVTSKDLSGTPFERAEFLFALRQYDEALPLYDNAVQGFKPNKYGLFGHELQDSIRRKLSIYLRAKRSLDLAKKDLETDVKRTSLPLAVSSELRKNLGDVNDLMKVTVPNVEKASASEMETFAATTITGVGQFGSRSKMDIAKYLFVSGLIYEFVQSHDIKELSPGLFYWLGKCEQHITKNYYFPISEVYFKECIVKYPTSSDAKLCFNELEKMTLEGYTGSMGTMVPEEEEEELNRLKKMTGN